MPRTLTGTFETRRAADIAIEHLVQEYGIDRTDIVVAPVSDANSVGSRAAGADVESGHPGTATDTTPALAGALTVTVDIEDDETEAVTKAFADAGATSTDQG